MIFLEGAPDKVKINRDRFQSAVFSSWDSLPSDIVESCRFAAAVIKRETGIVRTVATRPTGYSATLSLLVRLVDSKVCATVARCSGLKFPAKLSRKCQDAVFQLLPVVLPDTNDAVRVVARMLLQASARCHFLLKLHSNDFSVGGPELMFALVAQQDRASVS